MLRRLLLQHTGTGFGFTVAELRKVAPTAH
jgi:hypothetical protein